MKTLTAEQQIEKIKRLDIRDRVQLTLLFDLAIMAEFWKIREAAVQMLNPKIRSHFKLLVSIEKNDENTSVQRAARIHLKSIKADVISRLEAIWV